MKITGPNGTGAANGARPGRVAGSGGGFTLPDAGAASGSAPTGGIARTGSVMGVDALLALQAEGGPTEGKRRSVRRAGRILDVLDEIKVALLDGNLSAGQLQRLKRAMQDERLLTGDPKLEALLDDIELRAAVEIAKLEQAAAHAA